MTRVVKIEKTGGPEVLKFETAKLDKQINHFEINICNLEQVKKIMPHLKKNVVILFSSQLPVGTIKKIQKYSEKKFPKKKER